MGELEDRFGEFGTNPEPRCACVLLLDTSGSMDGERIDNLNEGLRVFREALQEDDMARLRVEVAIVTFGPAVRVVQDFVTADSFDPPRLSSGGETPMGAAINRALDLVEQRKQAYKDAGIAYYRPWVFMITDGAPTDTWASAAERIKKLEASKSVLFWAVGVEEADMHRLSQISVAEPLRLSGVDFRPLFKWLSASQGRVSATKPGDQVALPKRDWEFID